MGKSDEIGILGAGFMRLCLRVNDEVFIEAVKKGKGRERKLKLMVTCTLLWGHPGKFLLSPWGKRKVIIRIPEVIHHRRWLCFHLEIVSQYVSEKYSTNFILEFYFKNFRTFKHTGFDFFSLRWFFMELMEIKRSAWQLAGIELECLGFVLPFCKIGPQEL